MVESGGRRPKYYTPNEVRIHNTLKDIWVSFLGKVYDLTPLCKTYAGIISNSIQFISNKVCVLS